MLAVICAIPHPTTPRPQLLSLQASWGVPCVFPHAHTVLTPHCVTADVAVLEALKTNRAFENVTWDMALEGQDPYAVGVAFKNSKISGGASAAAAAAAASEPDPVVTSKRDLKEASKKAKDPKKGFNKQ